MKLLKEGNNKIGIAIIVAVVIAMGLLGYAITSAFPFSSIAGVFSRFSNSFSNSGSTGTNAVSPTTAQVNNASSAAANQSGGTFAPAGFHGPTGTPQIKGPSSPPPNY